MTKDFSPTAHTRRRTLNDPPEQADVILVGTGIAGLVAGAYLARSGVRVVCFDSHYVAGGCATQFARGKMGERFNFDIGIHYLGDCGEDGRIPQILRGVGIEQDFVPMDEDGFDVFLLPDLTFRMPVGHDRFRDRLVEHFPQETKGIDRYVRFLREVDQASRLMVETRGKMSLRVFWRLLRDARILPFHQNSTMKELLDTCTKDPKLRTVLLGQHGDYALPPSEVSALLHAGLNNHYLRGSYYPKGGGQSMSDKLAQTIEDAGGSIHLRRGIEKIIIKDGRAVGVRTEERKGETQEFFAPIVVSSADFKKTMLSLVGPEQLPNGWVRRAKEGQMAEALFSTYLGIRGDLRSYGLTAANYWQFNSYNTEEDYQEIRSTETPRSFGAYITSASLKDPETTHHAPAEHQTLEVMTITTGDPKQWGVSPQEISEWTYHKSERYLSYKQDMEDQLIERLDNSFPGVRDAIVYRESSSPITHSRFTRASQGTSYGLAATPAQFMNNRPGFRTPIPGLYICGVSTRTGHGIVGAMESGLAAAHCIAKDQKRPLLKE
ncbi:MAG: NAD(P)/FAD-dependent oxidoreductase [Myxococcales bacterium]|nr:NAD(P)/FAD-dependent oxidoreductase [Myxococcales bacterium]